MALAMIVALSPIYLLLYVLIRINMGSPTVFRQERPGLNEKIFTVMKFRSMNSKRGEDGKLLPDAQRITPLGKFLRKSSLDELPQLFNVLKGDMSFVGPRPLLPRYLPYYTEEEKLRHSVRPGITGLAQVNGRNAIVVTEIPYMVNKSRLIESISQLVKDKRVDGIHALRDESDRSGMRIVIELKKDGIREVESNPELVFNNNILNLWNPFERKLVRHRETVKKELK